MRFYRQTPWSWFLICCLTVMGCNPAAPEDSAKVPEDSAEVATKSSEKPSNPATMVIPQEPEYYNGLYVDFAPTRSKSKRAEDEQLYPKEPATAKIVGPIFKNKIRAAIERIPENIPSLDDPQPLMAYLNQLVDVIHNKLPVEVLQKVWDEGASFQEMPDVSVDPLFLTCRVELARQCQGNSGALFNSTKLAMTNFRRTTYPALMAVWANQLRVLTHNTSDFSQNNQLSFEEYCDTLIYWLSEDLDLRGHELGIGYDHLDFFLCRVPQNELPLRQAFVNRISSDKRVPSWLQSSAKAILAGRLAWEARGNGFANTVTPTGYAEFVKQQKIAASHFQNALTISPHLVHPATAMIDIARNGNTEEDDEFWFKRSTSIQFDHLPAYQAFLMSKYPVWGGSSQEMLEFGRACVATNRFDTAVPFFMFRCISQVALDGRDITTEEFDSIRFSATINQTLLTIIENMLQNPEPIMMGSEEVSTHYLKSFQFFTLMRLRRFEEARNLLDSIEYKILPEALNFFSENRSERLTRAEAYALSGEFVTEYKQAFALATSTKGTVENYREVVKILEPVVDNLDGSIEQLAFKALLIWAKKQLAFYNGEVVKLEFDPDFLEWRGSSLNSLKFESPSAVVFDNRNSGPGLDLFSNVYPGPKIFEVTFEWLEKEMTSDVNIALHLCGFYDPGVRSRTKYQFADINWHPQNKFSFGLSSTGPIYSYNGKFVKSSPKIRILVDKEYMEVFSENDFIFRITSPKFAPAGEVRFGYAATTNPRSAYRISNVAIQKATLGRPPIEEGPEALIQYYTKAMEQNPNDGWPTLFRGMAKIQSKDLDGAMEDCHSALQKGAPMGRVAFYIGHIYDLKLDKESAKEWYKKCFQAEDGGSTRINLFGEGNQLLSNLATLQTTSRMRYNWLIASSDSSDPANEIDKPGRQEHFGPKWIYELHNAQLGAIVGNFHRSIFTLENIASDIPVGAEEQYLAQLEAYRKDDVYRAPTYKPSYYLLDEAKMAFFGGMEDDTQLDFRVMLNN